MKPIQGIEKFHVESTTVEQRTGRFHLNFSFDKTNSEHNYHYIGRQSPEFGSVGLDHPRGVVADDQGNVYIADTSNHRIQKYDSTGDFVSSWGSAGSGNEEFNLPAGLAIYKSVLYIADQNNNRIQRTDLDGNFLEALGSPTCSDFAGPRDISFDHQGNMYVAEIEGQRVQKLDENGNHLTFFNKGCPSPGKLRGNSCEVSSVAIDSNDNVYATYMNHKLVKYSSSGDVLATIDFTEGTPIGIAVDSEDNIFVVDSVRNKVLIYDASLKRIGSFGVFSNPGYVSIAKDDHIYIANSDQNHVEKFFMGPRAIGDFNQKQARESLSR